MPIQTKTLEGRTLSMEELTHVSGGASGQAMTAAIMHNPPAYLMHNPPTYLVLNTPALRAVPPDPY